MDSEQLTVDELTGAPKVADFCGFPAIGQEMENHLPRRLALAGIYAAAAAAHRARSGTGGAGPAPVIDGGASQTGSDCGVSVEARDGNKQCRSGVRVRENALPAAEAGEGGE